MSNYYDELRREIVENKQDSLVAETELENEKKNLIDRFKNGVGEDLRNNIQYYSKPILHKKPFKIRFKTFVNKIKYILFGGDYNGTETYI